MRKNVLAALGFVSLITTGGLFAQNPSALDSANNGPQNAVFVDENGKVGIGTTAPDSHLDVQGNIELGKPGTTYKIELEFGANNLNIKNKNAGKALQLDHNGSLKIRRHDGTQITNQLVIDSDGQMTITNLAGAGARMVTVNSSGLFSTQAIEQCQWGDVTGGISFSGGNVGIGPQTPHAKLDVAGAIRAHQLCDENGVNCKSISGGWADGDSLDASDGSLQNVVSVDPAGKVRISGQVHIRENVEMDKDLRIGVNDTDDHSAFIGGAGGGQIVFETYDQGDSWILVRGGAPSSTAVTILADDDGRGKIVTDELEVQDILQLQPQSSAPSSPTQGTIYYDSSGSGALCVHNGTGWDKVGSGTCS